LAEKPEPTEIFYRMPAKDVEFATDIRNTILSQTPVGGRAILWMVLLLFALFFYWAYVSEVEEVTRGNGKVIPSQQIQVIQNLEGGILSEILVKVGDEVKKGQLLLKIDKTRFTASFEETNLKYLSHRAKAARLFAEANNKQFKIPQEVVEQKPEIGLREKELYISRQNELSSNLAILNEQVKQRQHEIKELESKLTELQKTYKLVDRELNLTRPLVEQGAVSEVELLHLERQASEMNGEMQAIKLGLPKARSKVAEGEIAIKEEKLSFSNKAKEELNDVLAQLEGFSASSVALEDRLKRTLVYSPVHGTINRLLINTVGGVIQPGMDLIEIVPLDDTLLIEAQIKPADIAFLRPQQSAMVKFTAYDFTIYGGLEAKLAHISADSIKDDKGNSYYLATLRTTKNHLGTDANPLPIMPGMVTSIDILTGKKTILTYILKPILKASHTALRER
jgi:adhesin transport system membrane fusion protein